MMKKMEIVKISLKHFKGIKSFDLEADGCSVNIYGDNGTGKTSIFDSYTWLLFDKDSQNNSKFEIKTVDENNNVIHGLNHEVEGIFLIDEKLVTLRKVYAEKWTKKRGSAKQEFTGHTVDHFIDGVPVKKGEYDDRIKEIASSDVFKLLSDPTYFNEQLHWKEKRKTVIDVCGDVTDEEVISSNKDLSKLTSILNGRKLEDHQKVINNKRVEINKELEKIPVRIDEINHNLPDITNIDVREVDADLAVLQERKQEREQEISRIENGGEVAEKTKALREVESDLIQFKNENSQKNDALLQDKRKELTRLRDELASKDSIIRSKKFHIEQNQRFIDGTKKKMDDLREEWKAKNAKEFTFSQSETCPTCDQSLPDDQLDKAREKALADFNRAKSNALEEINKHGKIFKEDVEGAEKENEGLRLDLKTLEESFSLIKSNIDKAKEEYDDLKDLTTDIADNKEYMKKVSEKEALEKAIADLKEDKTDSISMIKEAIGEINAEMRSLEAEKAKVKQHTQAQTRIEELTDQERKLAEEYERLEEELYLTEEFIRVKVAMLEEKINSKFNFAKFKMFKEQVNGGLEETCETLYKGVPYSSGLNKGHQTIVGLDIINTLSKHYKFLAPIFIDNKESITTLPDNQSQVISLIVSESDKKLKTEFVNILDGAKSIASKLV
jgi:DNA repair exonuclease SbcCD ATPase subunit